MSRPESDPLVPARHRAIRAIPGAVVPMTYDWPGGCVTETLIAYDPSGREVARHSPPLCDRDRWVIGGPSPTPGL
jgi:hypothetical protein